jgi:chromosome segregation ATPase
MHSSVAVAGPLEATISNLARELLQKDAEGKDLQRHWINLQTELVAKQNENSQLSESQARLTSNFSILYQKKVGLERELDQEQNQVGTINCCVFTCAHVGSGIIVSRYHCH